MCSATQRNIVGEHRPGTGDSSSQQVSEQGKGRQAGYEERQIDNSQNKGQEGRKLENASCSSDLQPDFTSPERKPSSKGQNAQMILL